MELLVNFESFDPYNLEFDYVSNYFDLKDSLEKLFNRKVDLIEDGEQLNSLFREKVYQNKQLIYG